MRTQLKCICTSGRRSRVLPTWGMMMMMMTAWTQAGFHDDHDNDSSSGGGGDDRDTADTGTPSNNHTTHSVLENLTKTMWRRRRRICSSIISLTAMTVTWVYSLLRAAVPARTGTMPDAQTHTAHWSVPCHLWNNNKEMSTMWYYGTYIKRFLWQFTLMTTPFSQQKLVHVQLYTKMVLIICTKFQRNWHGGLGVDASLFWQKWQTPGRGNSCKPSNFYLAGK